MIPAAGRPVPTVRFGTRSLPVDRASVMAIVNRTPDSFYDRGATYSGQAAMTAVDRALAEGADIVDIGGVKAGPGDDVGVIGETLDAGVDDRVDGTLAATAGTRPPARAVRGLA